MDDLLKRSALQQLATLLTGDNPQHTHVVCSPGLSVVYTCMYGAEQNLERTHITDISELHAPFHCTIHLFFRMLYCGGKTNEINMCIGTTR